MYAANCPAEADYCTEKHGVPAVTESVFQVRERGKVHHPHGRKGGNVSVCVHVCAHALMHSVVFYIVTSMQELLLKLNCLLCID